MKTVLIGAGYRGKAILGLLRGLPFFELTAVADPKLGAVAGRSQNLSESAGGPTREPSQNLSESAGGPADSCGSANPFAGLRVYSDGPDDYRRMLAEERPELVFICSPWDSHIPQALDCLKAGCHVALEIRGGRQLGEYQPLMALAGNFPGKVFPLENLLFRRDILAVREMVKAGLFGEIVSLRGGYRHDLREALLDSAGVLGGTATDAAPVAGSAVPVAGAAAPAPGAVASVSPGATREKPCEAWRGRLYTTENADIYPTHGMAPLCMIAGIHSIASVTSFASKAAGLRAKLGFAAPEVTLGDIVNTVARTADGTLLSLVHDTTLPRPKSFGFEVQGTRGIWDEENHRIYIEGRSPFEEWESDAAYIDEYQDDMWRRWGVEAAAADQHHGGMDWIMLRAIEEDLRGGAAYPATLSDLALWTSITPLSAKSIAEGRTVIL